MNWLLNFSRGIGLAILARLKWLALMLVIGGSFIALTTWNAMKLDQEKQAAGIPATAQIVKTTLVKHRRGVDTYELDLAWKDANGKDWSSDKVKVTTPFAESFVKEGKVLRQTVAIKYLPEKPDVAPLVLDDFAKASGDASTIWEALAVTLVAAMISLWIFWPRTRNQSAGPTV